MNKLIRVGSRDSKLAVIQTKIIMEQLKKFCPDLTLELVTLKTTGDLILDRTLDKIGGKGLFVKELDQALLDGKIDIAVHSLKDLPMEVNEDLPIGALFKRGDPRDVLVLPENADDSFDISVIGSSSARRALQSKILYPNAKVESVRGNIITRLKKLDQGDYSALILAGAGLERAGLEHRISRYFSIEEMIPSAGQGILAVQARKDFDLNLLECVNDSKTFDAATAEREFVRILNGGCGSPIAAYAEINGTEMKLTGLYYNEETKQHKVDTIIGDRIEGKKLGSQLAEKLKGELV